jgi:diacylglycerol kinase family enzyme
MISSNASINSSNTPSNMSYNHCLLTTQSWLSLVRLQSDVKSGKDIRHLQISKYTHQLKYNYVCLTYKE